MNHPNPPDLAAEEQSVPAAEPSFAAILSEFEREQKAAAQPAESAAQAVHGTVIAVNAEGLILDVGRKMEGLLPAGALAGAPGAASMKAGDSLTVSITGRSEAGYYLLSLAKVARPKDWSSLEAAFAAKSAIGGLVTEAVKGGLRVDVGVPAFMPASRSGVREVAELETLIGQEIRCRIIKLEVAEEDVVVDRRVVLEEEEAERRQQAFLALQEGSVVRGTVRSLTDFGAFVDLGGVDGLLHVTDMAWQRVGRPADVVAAGDSVEVKILKIDRETRKISLGMKQLVPDPWTQALEKIKVGDRIKGKVARVADFGAFVELVPGVDGLVHVSEMSWSKRQRKPGEIVKRGEMVEVVVLGVDAKDKRISLGLKQALGDPWDDAGRRFPIGAVVEGPVVSLQKFGAFVDLGDGIEGMVHIGDIPSENRLEHPKEKLAIGEQVRAAVLEVDLAKRRIRLGMKQLLPTSADEYITEHKVGDLVTGRVTEAGGRRTRVELGDGVEADCRPASKGAPAPSAGPVAADISSLTQMLSAKWKGSKEAAASSGDEAIRVGQIRSFRIVVLDPSQKRIEVEPAE